MCRLAQFEDKCVTGFGSPAMEQRARQTCDACGAELAPGSRFCPSCGTPVAMTAAPEDPLTREDELKPVTALFADVVGSTRLGERLSPDESKALIGECVSMMTRAVEEYGGTLQAYMGDGICAYFGVPTAHEDDPERAARAALRIVEVVGEYATDIARAWGIEDFNVRVGINSGQTAVGLVGGADPQRVALGDTTNVAARLQAAAQPGTIAGGDATAQRLSARFAFEPLGDVAVKGRAEAVPAWRLVAPLGRDAVTRATPLVDREQERAVLADSIENLRRGRGQALVVVGEAGIGKTRLLDELRDLAGDEVTWLEGRCHSYGGPVGWAAMEMLRRWLGVEEADGDLAVRTKARARLGAVLGGRLDDVLPPLARLLRIRLDPVLEERVQLPPEALAREIRSGLAAWVDAVAARRPVVVALEDVHWADELTRELAEGVLELTDRAPVLLVATMTADPRSEGWRLRLGALAEFSHRTVDLRVGPLSSDASAELLRTILPGGLDETSTRDLVVRAEGNPLYLAELLRAVVEGGGVARRARTWTVTLGSVERLPPALENLLVARIDHLPEDARRILQTAAVIGRSFPLRVLEAVCGDEDLQPQLETLLRADVVEELRRYPELEYSFKHGLVQDAALSTLTPRRRRELYGRVATAYEALFADALEPHLERLAHYYAQSDDRPKALEFLARAGARAADVDAKTEARELLDRARTVALDLGQAEVERSVTAQLGRLGA